MIMLNVLLGRLDLFICYFYGKEQCEHSAKHLPLCSTDERKALVWNNMRMRKLRQTLFFDEQFF